jgi:hypothetical protein
MPQVPYIFRYDHILRDSQMRPVARVILQNDDLYRRGEPIEVALLSAPVSTMQSVRGYTFFVDGLPYQIPKNISEVKMKQVHGKHMVNNFYLEPVL